MRQTVYVEGGPEEPHAESHCTGEKSVSKNLEVPEAWSHWREVNLGLLIETSGNWRPGSKVFQMLSLQLLSFNSTLFEISHAQKRHQLEVETEEQNIFWTDLKVSLFPNSLTFGIASASTSVPQFCCLVH